MEKCMLCQIREAIKQIREYMVTQNIAHDQFLFAIHAHPNKLKDISIIKWIYKENDSIGGIVLDCAFGSLVINGEKISVIGSNKYPEESAVKLFVIPKQPEQHRFFKYSTHVSDYLNKHGGYNNG